MLPKRLLRLPLQRPLSPATQKPMTFARGLNICRGLTMVALSLWLAGCNKQQPVAQGPPAPEVTVSKPEQKEGVNWNGFNGRTANALIAFVVSQVSTHWSITSLLTWLNFDRNCLVRFCC